MSVKDLKSINPLVWRIKKTVRFWFITLIFFWTGGIGCCLGASSNATVAAAAAVVFLLIIFILYLKNHNRNIILRATLKDFENVQKVSMLVDSYKSMRFWIAVIFPLDIFLWPVLLPIKIIFYISYRRFKRQLKKLKKMVEDGSVVLQSEEIESDPFYSFLMREGLYEKPKKGMNFESLLEEEEVEEPEADDAESPPEDEQKKDPENEQSPQ